MTTASFSIRIAGKVQGVFYRASAHEKAQALNLCGFVLNEPDGSVYMEAEGDATAIEQLIAWCRQGPPRSRVDHVEVTQQPPKGYTNFSIRR